MSEKDFNGFMSMLQGGSFPMPDMSNMPAMPPMPFAPWGMPGGAESCSLAKDNFKNAFKTFWTQKMDSKKAAAERKKEKYNQFYTNMMELQDQLFASLPENTDSMPFGAILVIAPKDLLDRVKAFEEMANKHFIETADSIADFREQSRKQAYDLVITAMDNAAAKKAEVKKAAADAAATVKEKEPVKEKEKESKKESKKG